MEPRLVLQPFADDLSLFELLVEALAEDRYEELSVVVAWARSSGLDRLRPALEAFRARGGRARIILGIDEGGATVEGLLAALSDFDESFVLFDSASGTFHPKVYLLTGDEYAHVVVGSNNLTAGGLYANYEAAVSLRLNLAVEADAALNGEVLGFMDRLLDDDTIRPLSVELIERLRGDRRFLVLSESEARRRRSARDDDDSLGADHRGGPDETFGRSKHTKNPDPRRRASRRQGFAAAGTPVAGTREEGGSTASVVARWSKRLTRSDSGRPRPGSNTTAALRFTKAGQVIDQTRWFRERMFEDAPWLVDVTRPGRERAAVRFEVVINGIPRGTHELQLKHDAAREAGQNNFTTDLKWGSLAPVLREEDLTGEWATFERLSDASWRLTVERTAPSPFLR